MKKHTLSVVLVSLMYFPSVSTSDISIPPEDVAERLKPEEELRWLYSSTAWPMSTRRLFLLLPTLVVDFSDADMFSLKYIKQSCDDSLKIACLTMLFIYCMLFVTHPPLSNYNHPTSSNPNTCTHTMFWILLLTVISQWGISLAFNTTHTKPFVDLFISTSKVKDSFMTTCVSRIWLYGASINIL